MRKQRCQKDGMLSDWTGFLSDDLSDYSFFLVKITYFSQVDWGYPRQVVPIPNPALAFNP